MRKISELYQDTPHLLLVDPDPTKIIKAYAMLD